jgi:hypothetical protein
MSHGPNRYKAEKLKAEPAADRAAADPRAAARAQRIIAVWNARARCGRPAEFFPTFETALAVGCWRLTYCCPACRQMATIDIRDFADAHHPRAPISMVIPKLSCQRCCPNPPLAMLIELENPAAELAASETAAPPEADRPPLSRDPTPAIPTMEWLPDQGATHIRVWCGRWPHGCTQQGTVPIKGTDLHQTIVEFDAKLRCEKCGTVGGQAMPDWPTVQGQGSGNFRR